MSDNIDKLEPGLYKTSDLPEMAEEIVAVKTISEAMYAFLVGSGMLMRSKMSKKAVVSIIISAILSAMHRILADFYDHEERLAYYRMLERALLKVEELNLRH